MCVCLCERERERFCGFFPSSNIFLNSTNALLCKILCQGIIRWAQSHFLFENYTVLNAKCRDADLVKGDLIDVQIKDSLRHWCCKKELLYMADEMSRDLKIQLKLKFRNGMQCVRHFLKLGSVRFTDIQVKLCDPYTGQDSKICLLWFDCRFWLFRE